MTSSVLGPLSRTTMPMSEDPDSVLDALRETH
jgi:hypothetical protein